MRALPREVQFLQCRTVRGEGGDASLPGMKKKESERLEMIQWQALQKGRSLLSVSSGQQGGDDQSTTESRPVREWWLRVPIE